MYDEPDEDAEHSHLPHDFDYYMCPDCGVPVIDGRAHDHG